jgi:hypothetical protein
MCELGLEIAVRLSCFFVLFQRQMCNIAAIVFVHKAHTQNLIWLHWDGIIGECCVTRGQITDTGNTGYKTQNNEDEKTQLLTKGKQLYHFPRWTI